ncbi:Predicted dehydrogenase [Palleronia marisminoris]|uniref:Inositol 2-dehydrogenase n=1 Tax=Palleronia marisminoris TaxID=315423 RepID=A0A1Y5SZD1_9RHOB|nr:Gfo/Idh/MocA family oxidoreductase [Palleronia marisminoris]SFH09135.1 Predicted dehydrogenase [Palleronia marisminoris]SLN52438.1 Inositol 2-dehydrogenase [Palleronia marisminoris]
MKTYRVAVIGLGVGRGHIEEAWATLPGQFELTVVCDLDAGRRDSVAQEYGCDASDDFDAVIAREDIDIVDICTPPALHLPQVESALSAGKHVICEKPLAGSLDEIERLELAERRAPGVLMPVFQYRFGAGAKAARRIIDEGIAGKPLVATAETHWFRDAAYFDNPWRGNLRAELGGTMTTHAIHIHDMMSWLMGPVEAVFGRMATRIHDIETEDTASASVAFASGALGSLSACTGSHDEFSRLFMAFEHVSFETTRAPYAVGRGPWTITARDPERQARCDEIARACADTPERFTGQMMAFHDALEAGAPPPVGVADARAAIAFLTAFYRSAATQRQVTLPLSDTDPARSGWLPAAS